MMFWFVTRRFESDRETEEGATENEGKAIERLRFCRILEIAQGQLLLFLFVCLFFEFLFLNWSP